MDHETERTHLIIPTLVVNVGDTHCGSKSGLITTPYYEMVKGGEYRMKFPQDLIAAQWKAAWENVAELRKGKRLIVVFCGDPTEGIHHHQEELISNDMEDHYNIHIEAMDQALQIAGWDSENKDLLYYLGGTPVHCGQANKYTNYVAKDLGAIPFKRKGDRKARQFWWGYLQLEVNGVLLDYAHQGFQPGVRAWTATNTARLEVLSEMMRRLAEGRPVPRYMIRAHRHKKLDTGAVIHYGHESKGIVIPGWQAKYDHIYKVAATDITDIGMHLIDINVNGSSADWFDTIKVIQDPIVKV